MKKQSRRSAYPERFLGKDTAEGDVQASSVDTEDGSGSTSYQDLNFETSPRDDFDGREGPL